MTIEKLPDWPNGALPHERINERSLWCKLNEVIEAVNALARVRPGVIIGTVQPHTGPHFVTGLSIAGGEYSPSPPIQQGTGEQELSFLLALDQFQHAVEFEVLKDTNKPLQAGPKVDARTAKNVLIAAAQREYGTGEK